MSSEPLLLWGKPPTTNLDGKIRIECREETQIPFQLSAAKANHAILT